MSKRSKGRSKQRPGTPQNPLVFGTPESFEAVKQARQELRDHQDGLRRSLEALLQATKSADAEVATQIGNAVAGPDPIANGHALHALAELTAAVACMTADAQTEEGRPQTALHLLQAEAALRCAIEFFGR